MNRPDKCAKAAHMQQQLVPHMNLRLELHVVRREKNRPDKCAKAADMQRQLMRKRSLSLESLTWADAEPSPQAQVLPWTALRMLSM